MKSTWLAVLVLIFALSACNLPSQPEAASPEPASAIPATETPVPPTPASAATATEAPPSATLTKAPTETPTSIPTATETLTPIPTEPPTQTAVPTYAILRGKVNSEKLSCRYGPGPNYLYLYGMVQGANQDVIGRTDTGTWVLTKSRGDSKSCWVNAKFLDLNGDVMSLEMVYPDKYTIPPSNQNYRKPWDVAAVRSGNSVTISWKSEPMRPGDEESPNSVLYMVETWVCQNGQVVFTPIGAYTAQVTVTDEPGCATPSHGRVYFSEKHGYTGPSEIPWP